MIKNIPVCYRLIVLFGLVLFLLQGSLAKAQVISVEPELTTDIVSISSFLAEDGGLEIPADFRGSIDPAGYRMISGEGEPPRFTAENGQWVPGFNLPGTNGSVRAMLWDGSYFYIGGGFSAVGDIAANGIARWDGSNWSALGEGMIGPGGNVGRVETLAWDGSNLYAGGDFDFAGGTPRDRRSRGRVLRA
jgi:hypothetical protein